MRVRELPQRAAVLVAIVGVFNLQRILVADAFVLLRSASQCKAASVRPDGTVEGCISQFGDVRLSCGTSCRRGEDSLAWNQNGELRAGKQLSSSHPHPCSSS